MEAIGILDYLVGFAIMAGIYSVFSLGLNVHWGFTGLFNIGIAGFFALGAYASALLTTSSPDPTLFEEFKFGGNWSSLSYLDLGIDVWFVFGLVAAALCCGVIALVIGYVALRLRADYLAMSSIRRSASAFGSASTPSSSSQRVSNRCHSAASKPSGASSPRDMTHEHMTKTPLSASSASSQLPRQGAPAQASPSPGWPPGSRQPPSPPPQQRPLARLRIAQGSV